MPTEQLVAVTRDLSREISGLKFSPPVECVYNPLQYAWPNHEAYLRRFGGGRKKAIFLGMNPGPWGMAQTGVPFGDIPTVKDWLKLTEQIGRPAKEHPKRAITGLECQRVEVSGRRLWSWVKDRFQTPEKFFQDFMIINYCPLMFMEDSGRNRTPDRLPKSEFEPLFLACNTALRAIVEILQVPLVIGVGAFAFKRASSVLEGRPVRCAQILHPSPASPLANRGWAEAAEKQLLEIGVDLPSFDDDTKNAKAPL